MGETYGVLIIKNKTRFIFVGYRLKGSITYTWYTQVSNIRNHVKNVYSATRFKGLVNAASNRSKKRISMYFHVKATRTNKGGERDVFTNHKFHITSERKGKTCSLMLIVPLMKWGMSFMNYIQYTFYIQKVLLHSHWKSLQRQRVVMKYAKGYFIHAYNLWNQAAIYGQKWPKSIHTFCK